MTEVVAPQHQQHTTEIDPTKAENQPETETENQTAQPQTAQPETGTPSDDDTKKYAELAKQLAEIIEHALDRIQPILKMITEEMEKADNIPKDDFDEDKFIEKVQPLIEEATKILSETNGAIKGQDPTGELAKKAQRNYQDHKATPEEQRLAEALAKLTGEVTQTVEKARKKIKDMPKAGPKLGPLLALLQDPLFQILAGVGMLLNGVLTLVGNLLDTLGLGGIVRNLLAGLGLEKVLKSLGLGKIFETKK